MSLWATKHVSVGEIVILFRSFQVPRFTFLSLQTIHLIDVCLLVIRHGLVSKLTGAGGGGCGFTIIPPGTSAETVAALRQELHAQGYDCFETCVGGPGVLLHRV